MEEYENIIKFLDVSIRSLREMLEQTPKLDTKLYYQRELVKAEDARRHLRLNYYVYEDYLKTGEYEAPQAMPLPICKKCGQIKLS